MVISTEEKMKENGHSVLFTVSHILAPESNREFRIIRDNKILAQVVEALKDMGKRIVVTQGVYDLYHISHALYLEEAKKKGDILIVGVDSDELTRERKGEDRPRVPEKERLDILAGTRAVDILAIRKASDESNDLIELIRPDVLVTSETTTDFKDKVKKYLKQFCGEICTLPAQAKTSTTGRIRELHLGGARELMTVINIAVEEYLHGE